MGNGLPINWRLYIRCAIIMHLYNGDIFLMLTPTNCTLYKKSCTIHTIQNINLMFRSDSEIGYCSD